MMRYAVLLIATVGGWGVAMMPWQASAMIEKPLWAEISNNTSLLGFSPSVACDSGNTEFLVIHDSPIRNSRGKVVRLAAAEMTDPDPRERIC